MSRALLLLATLSLGCGTTLVQRHLLGPPGAPHTRSVRTILDGDPVPSAQPVALVHAVGRGLNADLPHVLDGLRAEAQRLGCDAVVQLRIARSSSTLSAVGYAVRWGARISRAPRPRGIDGQRSMGAPSPAARHTGCSVPARRPAALVSALTVPASTRPSPRRDRR